LLKLSLYKESKASKVVIKKSSHFLLGLKNPDHSGGGSASDFPNALTLFTSKKICAVS
jgi:hypothetical protein